MKIDFRLSRDKLNFERECDVYCQEIVEAKRREKKTKIEREREDSGESDGY